MNNTFIKVLTTALLVMGLTVALFSKYEVNCKLDKVLNESQIENVMRPEAENTFTDDWISIYWNPSPESFAFRMENKTNTTISIIWNDSAFVNEQGMSSKVFHGNMKLINKDEPIAPTNIPLLAKIDDMIAPVDYWYFGAAKKFGYGSAVKKWRSNPIWDNEIKDKEFEELKGKDVTFRVILCVKKGEERRVYHFFFNAVGKKI